jgi:hypothetical protein
MMRTEVVRIIGECVESGVYCVGLDSTTDGTARPVLLQCPAERGPDDEDDHFIVDEGGGSEPDAVAAWGFKDRTFVLRLTDEAKEGFDVGDGWRFDLRELDASKVTELEGWVARVLANVPRDDTLATPE